MAPVELVELLNDIFSYFDVYEIWHTQLVIQLRNQAQVLCGNRWLQDSLNAKACLEESANVGG